MSYQPNSKLDELAKSFAGGAILDIGGWYAPYPLATHVVDIMPYETRAQGHHPEPMPGERFTAATWAQVDITAPDLRLPFDDGYFDFSIFMNTVEDLHEFRPILRELSRVSKRGFIETPTRLAEQTVGIANRATTRVGYNHHKWIVDMKGDSFVFFDKTESFYQAKQNYAIPLSFTESSGLPRAHQVFWQNRIQFEICNDHALSRRVAREFKSGLNIGPVARLKDTGFRWGRRVRNSLSGVSDY